MKWDEAANPYEEAARQGSIRLAQSLERRRREREMTDPHGDPATVGVSLLGRYIRRSRVLANYTQRQLAAAAGVSQSMVSRVERGLEPEVPVARLIRLVQPLARFFPLGMCPHDHNCTWQPVAVPNDPADIRAGYIEALLGLARD